MLLILLGTSIPIADLFGIGVKILISEDPSATQKSSSRLNKRCTLTPGERVSSYNVTEGPLTTPLTLAARLKSLKRLFKIKIFSFISCLYKLGEIALDFFNKLSGGSL